MSKSQDQETANVYLALTEGLCTTSVTLLSSWNSLYLTPETRTMTMIICTGAHRADFKHATQFSFVRRRSREEDCYPPEIWCQEEGWIPVYSSIRRGTLSVTWHFPDGILSILLVSYLYPVLFLPTTRCFGCLSHM